MSKTVYVIGRFLTICLLLFGSATDVICESMSGDTIPPIIITPPVNDTVDCQNGNFLAGLTSWYIGGAGAVATDNGDTVSIAATIALSEAIAILGSSSSCPNQGEVEVGFFGIDTCGNSSIDTLFASFFLEDNEVPQVISGPENETVICNGLSEFLLEAWIMSAANSTIEDNCATDLEISYNWEDINGNTGSGNTSDPIDIPISREQCEWYVDVIFSVSDGCGNITSFTARFSIEDNDAPGFVPEIQDITLNCLNLIPQPNVEAIDACDGTVSYTYNDVSTQDSNESNCGFYNYTITRTFEASDICGNTNTTEQIITVVDTLAPFLNLADTITLDCELFFGNNLNNFLQSWGDLCSDVLVTFTQTDIDIDLCEFQVERTWTVRDRCNNITQETQIINVTRNNPPILNSLASNLLIPCESTTSYNQLLQNWLLNAGGASSSSLCTSIDFFAAVPGSYSIDDPSTFPGQAIDMFELSQCSGSGDGFTHSLAVDFVFFDNCGNASVSSAFAHIVDEEAPVIIEPCLDTIFVLVEDSCSAELTLLGPKITDNCGELESPKVLTETQELSSISPGDVTVPVDSMLFSLEPVDISNIIPGGEVIITVQLDNVDADDATEDFEIKDENGVVIGVTPNKNNQCGDTTLVITDVPAGILNFWALDGVVEFWVVPVSEGTLAINDVCLNSSVTVSLSYEIEINNNIEYAYSIDQEPFVEVPFGEEVIVELDVGIYDLEYRYIDCGGNSVSCNQVLNLRDNSLPVINCPADSILYVESIQTCQAAYFFDPELMATDECGLAEENPLQYFVTGASQIDLTPIEGGNFDFVILEGGESEISLVAFDASGNKDTCSFIVTVLDTIAPIALCQDLDIELLPNLDSSLIITVDDLDIGSVDFCGDITYELDQSEIDCSFIDSTIVIQMTVTDESGNSNVCNSSINVSSYQLTPTSSVGLCNGDTLYLQSNFPDSLVGVLYEFEWSGPNFTSDLINPIIPNVSEDNNGLYSLVVAGPGGCTAVGELTFDIDQLNKINISSDAALYCTDQEVFLSTDENEDAQLYIWFGGPPGMETEISTTDSPQFTLLASQDQLSYYVQLDYGDCLSSPSEAIMISVQEELIVNAELTDTTLCTGSSAIIAVDNPLMSIDYEWYDPSGNLIAQESSISFTDIGFADSGIYQLLGKSGACESDTFSLEIEVIEGLQVPEIDAENIFCPGSTITLSVNNEPNGTEYTWFQDGDVFDVTSTNVLSIPNASTQFSGNWQVSIIEGLCFSEVSQSIEISVEEELLIGASNDGPACEGDMVELTGSFLPGASYTWTAPDNATYEGVNVSVPALQGEYTLLVETAAGCQNSTSTFVEVNEAAMLTAVSNSSSACMNIGDSIVFVASVFPQGDYIYQWTGPGFTSDEESAVIDSFTLDNNGTYTLTVFNENCPSNILETEVSAALIPDQPELVYISGSCDGDGLVLESGTVVSGAEYVWNTPSGQLSSSDPMLSLPGAGIQIDGFYTLSIEVDGCTSEPSDTLSIDFGALPEDPTIIADQNICIGDDLSLFVAEDAASYIWTGLIDTVTTDGLLILSSVQSGGTINVQLQNQDCINENISTIEIVANEVPEPVEFFVEDIPSCLAPGETYDICISNYNADLSYSIINDLGQVLSVSEEDCITISAEDLRSGDNTLYLFSNAGDCRSGISDEIIISSYLDDLQGAFVQEGNFTICDNSEQVLNAVMIPDGADIVWSSPGDILNIVPDESSAAISNIQDGFNQVILSTNIGQCADVFVDSIEIFSITGVEANDDAFNIPSNDARIYEVIDNDIFDETVTLSIIGQPSVGEAFVDNGKITFIPESGFFGEVIIIYEICSEFCPDFCSRANLIITVGDEMDCSVPTIFTPNNDQVNDILVIECLLSDNFPGNQIVIFNQWGDEVFSAQPYNNDWQGTYSGRPLPAGTYYYVLDLNDGSRPVNGFIVLER